MPFFEIEDQHTFSLPLAPTDPAEPHLLIFHGVADTYAPGFDTALGQPTAFRCDTDLLISIRDASYTMVVGPTRRWALRAVCSGGYSTYATPTPGFSVITLGSSGSDAWDRLQYSTASLLSEGETVQATITKDLHTEASPSLYPAGSTRRIPRAPLPFLTRVSARVTLAMQTPDISPSHFIKDGSFDLAAYRAALDEARAGIVLNPGHLFCTAVSRFRWDYVPNP
jgi:hypothetical protein